MMRRLVAVFVGLAAVVVTAPALAFVQTMTCTESGVFACGPDESPKPVRWPERCITFYLNEAGTRDLPSEMDGTPDSALIQAVRDSFEAWNEPQGSDLQLNYGGLTNEDRAEFKDSRGPEGNANVVMWRDDEWPYASRTAFAITSVTFDPNTGLIADADMELNGAHHVFTNTDDPRQVQVDIRNTITHEAGHFLGLDHTPIAEATMYRSAPNGETQKRTLHRDDIAGLVHIYPARGTNEICPETSSYFEKPLWDEKSEPGCCATASSPTPPGLVWLPMLVGALWWRRRRRNEDQLN